MRTESKWVKWYRILAIIGCIGIIIGSVVMGWDASHYSYNAGFGSYYNYKTVFDGLTFFLYIGGGCAIAAVELVASMMVCEFFDNVNTIKEIIQGLSYSKDVKEFLPTFKKMSGNVDAINKEIMRKMTE